MTDQRNTLKTDEVEEKQPQPKSHSTEKKIKVGGRIKGLLEGSFLAKEKVTKMLPFLIFLTLLGLILIYSSNIANRTVIEISRTKKQIEEYRYSYINTKSKLLQTSKQSEIAKRLVNRGIKESKIPPRKIIITSTK